MSERLPVAHDIVPAAPDDRTVSLSFEARFLRRKRLVADDGDAFMVDLPGVRDVRPGEAFALGDGRRVAVRAALQDLLEIRGDLARFAWHIGNRHTPCQIEPDRLLIEQDPVLEQMLKGLGANLVHVQEPFTPERGAYGHGRTMGHAHD